MEYARLTPRIHCYTCRSTCQTDVTLTLNKAPKILHIGFLNFDEGQQDSYDYHIDLEMDASPFFKTDCEQY